VEARNSAISAQLDVLTKAPIAVLRRLWAEAFGAQPPRAFGPDLLKRSLAQKIQEDAFGGLPAPSRRLLNQLIGQHGKNSGKIVLPRRIKPGATLVREWKGKSHRVTVLAEGFAWDDKQYASLSEIARSITGARWNGPRFFGLRNDKDEAS
jgi:hypothetical protein